MKFIAASATAALAFASPAFAATVYDNGTPTTSGGNEATAWVQTEDFSFATATTLGGAGVYIGGFGDISAYDGAFQYYLFDDAGGNPGTILQTASVTPTITTSGFNSFSGSAYLFAFDFSSAFTAAAGATYHLGIHASGPGDYNRDEIYWLTTALNATQTGIESEGGTFNNFINNNNEHSFYLTDAAAAVPETATWAMMLAGFGMVGFAMRRRSSVKTTVSYA